MDPNQRIPNGMNKTGESQRCSPLPHEGPVIPLRTLKAMLFGMVLASLPAASLSAADSVGTFQMGEGRELIVTRGIVVREVAGAAKDKLPMLAIGSADGHHFLYDPNQLTTQGVWSGQFGHLDEAGQLVPIATGMKSFFLDRFPWTFGERPRRECKAEWQGYGVHDGKVFLRYRLSDKESGILWEVEETPEFVTDQTQQLHFKITPGAEAEDYLNYWLHQTDFRRVTTNGQQNQRDTLKNLLPNQKQFTISFLRRKETPTVPHGYTVKAIDIPTPQLPARFEPTGFDFAPDGSVYVSTRTGGVWHLQDGKWVLFADGLEEVNGVQVAPDGSGVYVMQKPELTLLRDTDHDGRADVYETMEDRFRFSGHYHEFAYGPRMNAQGDLFFSLGLSANGHHMATTTNPNQMTTAMGYRGWVMKRTASGELIPFASGLRSPAGIGMNSKDELFVTDNQGDWVASSYLSHVEAGDFLGHPASTWDLPEHGLTPGVLDYQSNATIPEKVPPLDLQNLEKIRKRPAVWLAHGDLTNSPGHPSFAPESGFGPFGGQAFIADIAHRNIIRVALEKVGGKYQGAVFPFLRPLRSAAYSTAFDPQGNLWVGAVGRGWVAGDPAIEIIRHEAGTTPFEMHHIALTRDGFEIHFTEPLGAEAVTVRDVSITEFQYEYWDSYGSERFREATVPLSNLEISADRTRLSLRLPLKAEFIYEIQLPQLTSRTGLRLENNFAYYTLNQLLP